VIEYHKNLRLSVEVMELIRRYGLGEDQEHIIIPVRDEKGKVLRIFLLKRGFMRIMNPEGNYADYPLEEAIEATVRYPSLSLSEALRLLHEELDAQISRMFGEEKEVAD
jgi:hypothetical protein